jgi:hypothetical protein
MTPPQHQHGNGQGIGVRLTVVSPHAKQIQAQLRMRSSGPMISSGRPRRSISSRSVMPKNVGIPAWRTNQSLRLTVNGGEERQVHCGRSCTLIIGTPRKTGALPSRNAPNGTKGLAAGLPAHFSVSATVSFAPLSALVLVSAIAAKALAVAAPLATVLNMLHAAISALYAADVERRGRRWKRGETEGCCDSHSGKDAPHRSSPCSHC